MIKPPNSETYELCNCLYNDLLTEENSAYVLK